MTTYRLFRGEHGSCPDLSTRHGALTFCNDYSVCELYARKPNNRTDTPVNPRVITAMVTIANPFINQPTDPFIDIAMLMDVFGVDYARQTAQQFASDIQDTNNWQDRIKPTLDLGTSYEEYIASDSNLRELYFQAWPYFDDKDAVATLRRHGYDGAIMAGSAQSIDALEYRVFSASQVEIVGVTSVEGSANENKISGVDTAVSCTVGVSEHPV